jgi:hypothetical protein
MPLREKLSENIVFASVYRRLRDIVSGVGWGAFHLDPIYRQFIIDLAASLPFTAFAETGTFRGYSTELIASRFPKLPIFTSEVYEPSYRIAKAALNKYPNVTAELRSSDEFLQKLLESDALGKFPLFFLDAHWQRYWPLRAELAHIAATSLPAVIVIDDFQVPGQPQFGFDVDGGGEVVDGLNCNLEYVLPSLGKENTYHAVFPRYSPGDAFGSHKGIMRGHIAIFQNAADEYRRVLERPLMKSKYFGFGKLEGAVAVSSTA